MSSVGLEFVSFVEDSSDRFGDTIDLHTSFVDLCECEERLFAMRGSIWIDTIPYRIRTVGILEISTCGSATEFFSIWGCTISSKKSENISECSCSTRIPRETRSVREIIAEHITNRDDSHESEEEDDQGGEGFSGIHDGEGVMMGRECVM